MKCDELKVETVVPQGSAITLQMYGKAEVDAAIAKLKEQLESEKDEPYVGDYGLTVSDNEDECEFTVAINYCPMCGRKLNEE